MDTLAISFSSFHQIELEQGRVTSRTIDEGDLEEYLQKLIEEILQIKQNRLFTVRSQTTEVVSQIYQIVGGNLSDSLYIQCSDVIARRLLAEERKAQEKYQHLTTIQKGSLIQSLLTYDNNTFFLIAKIEDEEYMERERLIKQLGLPFQKKALKFCLLKISQDGDIEDVLVGDSSSSLRAYWWDDFLELRELNSNEKNTKTAFNAIDHHISKKIKKESPSDYQILKNNLIGFFRTQEDFSFDDMVNAVFGSYVPDNPNIDIDEVKNSLQELPEEKSFDRRFTIKPGAIKARMKRIFHVTDKIELKLTDHIDNLRDTIKSSKTDDGEMYINIKTDKEEIYKMFKRSE